MSLDITLYRDGIDRDFDSFNKYELRHLVVNFAISSLNGYNGSFDCWFAGLDPDWWIIANRDNPDFNINEYREQLFSTNITHNLNRMAAKAGIYYALWRPEEINCKFAKDVIPYLEKGLKYLKSTPEKYKKYDSSNGWGVYNDFVPFVAEYLEECKNYPDSIIEVDR